LVVGHSGVTIPEGTRVATPEGVIFRTVDDAIGTKGAETITIPVLAEIEGTSGNGHLAGVVSEILDPLAYVSSVRNVDVTGGGSDIETDESLRERIKLAPARYSTAGSRGGYLYYARSASPAITDVSVSSPAEEPGRVVITVLTNEPGGASPTVLAAVAAACNADTVRPLTDIVSVQAATRVAYAIDVFIFIENTGVNGEEIEEKIEKILRTFAAEKEAKLGSDIVVSHIVQKCLAVDGVYDVDVRSPTSNVSIEPNAYAHCTNIIVQY
jgi:phage-related baseplate assembly protein